MRLDKLRNAEVARRNRERLRNPATFPSVPKNDIWGVAASFSKLEHPRIVHSRRDEYTDPACIALVRSTLWASHCRSREVPAANRCA